MNISILGIGIDPLVAQDLYMFTTGTAIELISSC